VVSFFARKKGGKIMASIVQNGLIAYYNSKQGVTSTTWKNLAQTGTQYDGILKGSTPPTATTNGMQFSSTTGGFVAIPMFQEILSSSSTIEFRINIDNSTTEPDIWSTADDANGTNLSYGLYPLTDGTSLLISFNGSGSGTFTNILDLGQDTYISIVLDTVAQTVAAYKNGVLFDTKLGITSTSLISNNQKPYFLITDSSYPINGTLDNFRVYNRALSSSDISANYSVGTEVGLVNDYVPTVPTSLSTSVNGTGVTFNGIPNDQDGGSAYLAIEYSTDQTFATKTSVTQGGQAGSLLSFAVNGLSPTTTYYWRARTYDGTNYSSYSSVMNFTTGTPLAPSLSNFTPATQSRYNAGTSVTLGATATSPNGLNSTLTFQYSTDKTFATGVTTITSVSTPSGSSSLASLSSSLAKGVYYWRVQATDSNNTQSAWSSIFVFYINGTATENLSPDAIISQTNTTGTVSNVQDSPSSPDANSLTATTTGTANDMRLSFPTPSKSLSGTQTFNVWASATNTNGAVTSTISIYENGVSKASGTATTVSTTGQILTFTWDASILSDPTGSNVEIYISNTGYSGGGAKKTNVSIGAVQWVTKETDNPATVADPNPTDTTPPANVTNLQASKTLTSVTLTWTNPTDSDFSGTKIYRDGTYIGDGGTSGTYTDNGRNPNTTYVYKVTSIDTSTNESTGTTLSVTTLSDTTPPANVTGLAETHTSTSVTLTWTNPTDSDFSYTKVYKNNVLLSSNITSGTITDSGLTASTAYTYKVTSVDTTGNESTGSTITATTSAQQQQVQQQAPSTPTNLFPFNNSAWTKLHFEADVTDSDSTNLTFYVEYSTNSTLSTGVTTLSAPVTLSSVGATARASITSANTVVESTVYYWRAYVSDGTNQSAKTTIFNFTAKFATGDNMVADGTPFMQQGDPNVNIHMVDVSDYQATVNWSTLKTAGLNYAYLCTHHGSGADDTQFATNVTNSRAQGIKTGGYYYPMPSSPALDLANARSEADHFISLLQAGYGTGQYGDLLPVLDIEDNSAKAPTGQSMLDMTVQDLLLWVNEFRNHFESVTGRRLMLYTGEYFVRNQRNNFNHDYSTGQAVAGTSGNIVKDMPLWIQGYTQYPRYMGYVVPAVGGWTKWYVFQYSDTGAFGGINPVDEDLAVPDIEWIMPPKPVSGLVGTDDGTNINLTWTPTTEKDVHDWDIYVDGTKVGSTTTNGSYTINAPTRGTQHTIEVRPIDDFGDDPTVSPTTISYTLGTPPTTNPPNIQSITVDHTKISHQISSNVTFSFDKDVKEYRLNINGASYSTGTIIASGGSIVSGGLTVGSLATMTVSSVSGNTVAYLKGTANPIVSGSAITVTIDWSEMLQEGDNRINIYGRSQADDSWTPYNS
jgi:lysozyme